MAGPYVRPLERRSAQTPQLALRRVIFSVGTGITSSRLATVDPSRVLLEERSGQRKVQTCDLCKTG